MARRRRRFEGPLVSIHAIATNPTIAGAIRAVGTDHCLAVKTNQQGLRREIEADPAPTPPLALDTQADIDKGHGRIEERRVDVLREVDWLDGDRRFPGEPRLPGVAALIRFETRYYVTSATRSAGTTAHAVRRRWAIENSLHWVLDAAFNDDRSRLRKGHGAQNMAIVRHFAPNLVRGTNRRSRSGGVIYTSPCR